MSNDARQFVFMTCRAGAEGAVKAEVARVEPEWRLSFSRPGFLTFKHAGKRPIDDRELAERNWTFAHAHGISLGHLTGDSLQQLAAAVWGHEDVATLVARGDLADIHVWQPESTATSESAATSLVTPLCEEIESAVRAAVSGSLAKPQAAVHGRRRATPRNGRVLDIIVLQPGEWWLGHHRAVRRHERWPGGAIPVRWPEHAVSRAYVKI